VISNWQFSGAARTFLAGALLCGTVAAVSGCATSRPSASARLSSSPTDVGAVYPDVAGHFRARFRGKPTAREGRGTIGGNSFTAHYEVSTKPYPTEVGEETVKTPLPSSDYQATLRVGEDNFAAVANLTPKKPSVTFFRGYPARQVTMSATDGETYTMLAFFYSKRRFYWVFAPAGQRFHGVVQSFALLQ